MFPLFAVDVLSGWSAREYLLLLAPLMGTLLWAWIALSIARLVVKERRRFYRNLWKRAPIISPSEEEAVVLLGRIRGFRQNARLLVLLIAFTAVWLVWQRDSRTPKGWHYTTLIVAFIGCGMSAQLHIRALETAKAIR